MSQVRSCCFEIASHISLFRCARKCLAVLGSMQLMLASAFAVDPPKIQRHLPAGGQIGKTHEISLKGTFGEEPLQFWTDSSDFKVQATDTPGKVSVTVSPDAEPGVRYFRLYNSAGASDLLPFIVDRCVDSLESEPNDHHAKSQPVDTLPISIHGCLEKSGDVDTYQVVLNKGQTLVASLDAQRFLNSPMDADFQVLSAGGVVLSQQLDHHGLDPQLQFTAPADGNYLVRLMAFPDTPNSTIAYAGGERFVYRLMLTTGPFIDTTLPACLSRQQLNRLTLVGTNLASDIQQIEVPAVQSLSERKWFSLSGHQGLIELPITNHAIVIDAEPNESSQPQSIDVPAVISGCISNNRDQDAYRFRGQKGQRLKIRVEAQEYGSSLDAVLTVVGSDGKQLATNDDTGGGRDALLAFAVPSDGDYTVKVHDMYRHSGPSHWYRLFVTLDLPDFSLSTAANLVSGKVGQPIEIVVNIDRKLDFAADITCVLDQLPEGALAQAVSRKGDESAKSVKLTVKSDQPFAGPVRIFGRSESGLVRTAKPDKIDCEWLWLTIVKE